MSMTDDKYRLEEVSNAKSSKVCWVDNDGNAKGFIETYDMVNFSFLDHRYITETDETVEETIQHIADIYLHESKYKDSKITPNYNTETGDCSYICRRSIRNDLGHIIVTTHGITDIEALQNNDLLLNKIIWHRCQE